MSDYERWNRFRSFEEGGHAHVKGDRGGDTWYGITRAFYDACQRRGEYLDVSWPPSPEIASLMGKTEFWDVLHGDELPWPVNAALADWCFHSGDPHGASYPEKELQRQVGVTQDGAIGSDTIAAVQRISQKIGARTLAQLLNERRMRFCMDLAQRDSSQVQFIEGWAVRILRIDRLIGEA